MRGGGCRHRKGGRRLPQGEEGTLATRGKEETREVGERHYGEGGRKREGKRAAKKWGRHCQATMEWATMEER